MLNKRDFFRYASKLAFPIMLQNLISTLVNMADTVMLGYVSQTAMSASSLANQFTVVLFCLYYGLSIGTSVLCAQYFGKGDKPLKRYLAWQNSCRSLFHWYFLLFRLRFLMS